jgi:hypothetical protein
MGQPERHGQSNTERFSPDKMKLLEMYLGLELGKQKERYRAGMLGECVYGETC